MPSALDPSSSVTRGDRALALFQGRVAAQARFVRRLHRPDPRSRVLFFHGDGGQGKSLLLRHLAARCCRHLNEAPDWAAIATLGDQALLAAFDAASRHQRGAEVPSALIDFAASSHGEYNPQEATSALAHLRRELGRQGLRFPLFDFAMVLLLHKTRGLDAARVRELFGSQPSRVAAGLLEDPAALRIPAHAAARLLELVAAELELDAAQWLDSRQLSSHRIERIARLDAVRDLPAELVQLFADDLVAELSRDGAPHRRVVLFFDTHEAFWGTADRADPARAADIKDEWLRRLLRALRPEAGTVAVVTGRVPPRWARAADATIGRDEIDLQPVGNLNGDEAARYLAQAGIAATALHDALLQMAMVEAGQYHPLYLGLCADMVLAAQAEGAPLDIAPLDRHGAARMPDRNGQGALLLARLFAHCPKEAQDAVCCMAAARQFDADSFRHVADALQFDASAAALHRLASYSFVNRGADGRFQIHALIRRILRAKKEPRLRMADAELEAWYRARADQGDLLARAEATYHALSREPVSGAAKWTAEFNAASSRSQHTLCLALGALLDDGAIEDKNVLAEALCLYANYLGRTFGDRAVPVLLVAADTARARLAEDPRDAQAHFTLGSAHWLLAYWCYSLRSDPRTLATFGQALSAFRAALALEPRHVNARRSLGNVHSGLGDWHTRHGDPRAFEEYGHAVENLLIAVELDPRVERTHNNLGLAYRGLAGLHAARNDPQALAFFSKSIDAFGTALRLAPHEVRTYNNLGIPLLELAQWQAAQRDPQALASFERAIANHEAALALSPAHNIAVNNLGMALRALADWYCEGDDERASASYERAILCFEQALEIAPQYLHARNNLSQAQRGLACWYSARGDPRAPLEFASAIQAAQQALELAPEDAGILRNLGAAQEGLAGWNARQDRNAFKQ